MDGEDIQAGRGWQDRGPIHWSWEGSPEVGERVCSTEEWSDG